ncbi:hypothetical protein ACX80W_15615 [Arthrobacter sp. TMN-37]
MGADAAQAVPKPPGHGDDGRMGIGVWTSVGAAAAVALVLSGCAGNRPAPGAAAADPLARTTASTELVGQGTVLQQDGGPARLCLGGVMESYPPQCSGPEIRGWDWSAVEQWETASGVTWGTYAVFGTWDGRRFTTTKPAIPLSLYDAMPYEDPRLAEGRTGSGSGPQLEELHSEILEAGDPPLVGSWITQGYLVLTVVHDDGEIQRALDERYGKDLILVQSALRPAG